MRSSAVIKAQIAPDGGAGFLNVGVDVQVNLFVFDGPPQALDEDVVAPRPFAIHADLVLPARQSLDEVGQDELAALYRVEYLGLAVLRQRPLYGLDTEAGDQRARHPPGQHTPSKPVQNVGQVDEAPRHRNVDDVRG